MEVNSSAIIMETPAKDDVASDSAEFSDGEPKEDLRCQRLSVSSSGPLQTGLSAIDRLHTFLHTNELMKIEDMKLTLTLRNSIRELFVNFDQDISDWILRMEEHATETNVYSTFIRDYISYEFLVLKEHSFAVLALLNYIKKFKLSPETAFGEIFNISVTETFCRRCNNEDVDFCLKNLVYLKRLINQESEALDDSYLDKSYRDDSYVSVSSDNSNESASKKSSGDEYREIRMSVNPFDDSSEDVYEFNDEPDLGLNPFELETEENKQDRSKGFKPSKTSSVKDTNICSICGKVFSTKYNMKLHLIQVHRLSVPNMTELRCPYCDFITGSKVLLIRHKETHSKDKTKRKCEIVCNICNERFANKSSLRRHNRRKHTT